MVVNQGEADAAASAVEAAQRSIRERISDLGSSLTQAPPLAMVAVLAGAALWPVVAPLLGAGTAAAMVSGGLGLLSGPGNEFISRFLKRRVGPHEGAKPPDRSAALADLERELRERLEAQDEEAAALRADMSRLLRSVGGVETALAAAAGDVQESLARGLAESSATWSEFRWMLGELEERLHAIQARQAEGLALQRESLDLQREQLVKTTLLLQIHSAPGPAAPVLPEPDSPADVPCPYKGLQAFQPEDSEFFFGREALVADVLARLTEARFVAVVGPSGSGKSSFVRAGLVASIWRGGLPTGGRSRVVMFTPGERPVEQLALRLALLRRVSAASLMSDLRAAPRHIELAVRQAMLDEAPGDHLVLVVDQFEELFTLCGDEAERRCFVEALVHAHRAADCPAIVILAIRADFYGGLAAYPELAAAVQEHQALVGRMTPADLRRAIEEPARAAGLALEPGLVATMLDDLGDEPGSLPLLSHALLETWSRRSGRTLTVAGYLESGGVRGAIAETAERIFVRLARAEQSIARSVFLGLAEIGDSSEPTRRRAGWEELTAGATPAAVRRVIGQLAEARLVIAGDETVEVAHEALIRHWPRLRRWLDESREGLLLQRRLTQAAREWQGLGRDPGALYRGARLAATVDWAADAEPGDLEGEFLEASREAERDEAAAAARRARRLRLLAGSLAVLVVVAAVAALLAVRNATDARSQERLALTRLSQSLATHALSVRDSDPELAALLGLEAYRTIPSFEARNAVVTMLPDIEHARGAFRGHRLAVTTLAFSADGSLLATGSEDESVRVWEVESLRQRDAPLEQRGMVNGMVLRDDDTTLAVAADSSLGTWDLATQQPVRPRLDAAVGFRVAFSPDTSLLASVPEAGRRIQLWDVARGRALRPALIGHGQQVLTAAFSPDGRTLASGGNDTTVRLWDVGRRRQLGPPLQAGGSTVWELAFSPNGELLATGGVHGEVRLWDLQSRRQVGRLAAAGDGVGELAFSADGRALATAVGDDVHLWDVAARQPSGEPLKGHSGSIYALAFSPDGKTLASAGEDRTIRLWNASSGRPLGRPLRGHQADVYALAYSRDGSALASGGLDPAARLWNVSERRPLARPMVDGAVTASVMSLAVPDGGTIVAAALDASVSRWDATTGRARGEPFTIPGRAGLDVAALSGDGGTLAASGPRGTARLWDVATGRPRGDALEVGPVAAMALTRDAKVLAVGAPDGTASLWDVAAGRSVGGLLRGHTEVVTGMAFSPDRRTLATVAADRTARLWDARNGRPLGGALKASDELFVVAFSPGGRRLATGGDDGSVRLWDVETQRPVGQPLGGGDSVTSVAFSRDGGTLAVGDAGGPVELWDVRTGNSLGQPLVGPSDAPVRQLVFAPDGRSLASGADDGSVIRWDSLLWSRSERNLRDYVCDRVRRSLTRAESERFFPGERRAPTCAG